MFYMELYGKFVSLLAKTTRPLSAPINVHKQQIYILSQLQLWFRILKLSL
jgi:hypothetical protein